MDVLDVTHCCICFCLATSITMVSCYISAPTPLTLSLGVCEQCCQEYTCVIYVRTAGLIFCLAFHSSVYFHTVALIYPQDWYHCTYHQYRCNIFVSTWLASLIVWLQTSRATRRRKASIPEILIYVGSLRLLDRTMTRIRDGAYMSYFELKKKDASAGSQRPGRGVTMGRIGCTR